jgi:hypothetical protein
LQQKFFLSRKHEKTKTRKRKNKHLTVAVGNRLTGIASRETAEM